MISICSSSMERNWILSDERALLILPNLRGDYVYWDILLVGWRSGDLPEPGATGRRLDKSPKDTNTRVRIGENMNRGGKIVVVAIALAVVLVVVVYGYVTLQDPQDDGSESSVLPVVPFGQPVPGTPQMNTTDVWIVIVGEVSIEAPISAYKASLLHEGQILVGPETLRPGLLGENGVLDFLFYEGEPNGSCRPGPCDGMLSHGDYLEISSIEPGETYVFRIHWGATGEILSEVVVNT
jgi:hypothetical protein